VERIQELARQVGTTPDDRSLGEGTPVQVLRTPVVQAEEPDRVEMDKAGYLVILPQPTKGTIVVEHYSYDNRLRRVIEGRDARAICHSIVTNAWMTRLSHAAYLGKELARAELSLSMGFRYVQDGA
jgi:tetrahydromethanopterin S-methyltransferase subunit A